MNTTQGFSPFFWQTFSDSSLCCCAVTPEIMTEMTAARETLFLFEAAPGVRRPVGHAVSPFSNACCTTLHQGLRMEASLRHR